MLGYTLVSIYLPKSAKARRVRYQLVDIFLREVFCRTYIVMMFPEIIVWLTKQYSVKNQFSIHSKLHTQKNKWHQNGALGALFGRP